MTTTTTIKIGRKVLTLIDSTTTDSCSCGDRMWMNVGAIRGIERFECAGCRKVSAIRPA